RTLPRNVPEEVCLRRDVGVQRALLEPERLREVADGRAVIALLGEEPGRGARQLGLSGGDTLTLTIVRKECGMASVEVPRDEQAFLEYVQSGGQVEATDWL